MPRTDHTGVEILEPNSSCNQRFDLPGGDVLLPIRYRRNLKTREYTTIIARGHDGLYYEPFQEWTFDDRQALGRSNAQQHWVAHSVALQLIDTWRGANNDHVFRQPRSAVYLPRG